MRLALPLSPLVTVALVALVAVVAVACVADVPLEGKRCDDSHPCVTGTCIDGTCRAPSEGEGEPAGEGEGEEGEGEGEGGEGGEGEGDEGEGEEGEGEEGEGEEGGGEEGEGEEGEGEGEPAASPLTSTLAIAGEVPACSRAVVTLTARDSGGALVGSGGASVSFGGGSFSPVVDDGDGEYTALFLGTSAGTANITASIDGSPVLDTAQIDVLDEPLPAVAVFHVDAARRDGSSCAGGVDGELVDAGGLVGAVAGIDSCNGTSGWCGSGLADDPVRLAFDGFDDIVTFGPELSLARHTITAWIRPRGAGSSTTTGTGGITLVPLIAKGTAEAEQAVLDESFFIGLTAGRTVGADFEEDPGSLNHPLTGAVTLDDDWHHIAVTYDPAVGERVIYVDGVVDTVEPLVAVPAVGPSSELVLGASMRTDGVVRGHFSGDVAVLSIFDGALDAADVRLACEAFALRFVGVSCD